MRVLTCANHKGGVGKSAIAAHLGWYAAQKGIKVLVCDFDRQRTLSRSILGDTIEGMDTTFGLFYAGAELPVPYSVNETLHVIQGDPRLDQVDEDAGADEHSPKAHFERMGSEYDLCIIDPPPTLGKRTRAALAASDFVVMPFMPVRESTDGLVELNSEIDFIRQINPGLINLGFLANKVNARSNAQIDLLAQVSEVAGDLLLPCRLVERAAVSDSLARSIPVWKNTGGESHRAAAREMREACQLIMERMFK